MKVMSGNCPGCGIDLKDGYTFQCVRCSDRRMTRLRRGERYTPNGYACEAIDNQTGRIVFMEPA